MTCLLSLMFGAALALTLAHIASDWFDDDPYL